MPLMAHFCCSIFAHAAFERYRTKSDDIYIYAFDADFEKTYLFLLPCPLTSSLDKDFRFAPGVRYSFRAVTSFASYLLSFDKESAAPYYTSFGLATDYYW